jgi:hypothetical protein
MFTLHCPKRSLCLCVCVCACVPARTHVRTYVHNTHARDFVHSGKNEILTVEFVVQESIYPVTKSKLVVLKMAYMQNSLMDCPKIREQIYYYTNKTR